MTRRTKQLVATGAISLALLVGWWLAPADSGFKQASTWQRMTEPGGLSEAHAHLSGNCAACHTAVTGLKPAKCIVCHANDESILQRQPTSFHAGVTGCRECHPEHLGSDVRPTQMDHEAVVRLGLRQLRKGDPSEQSTLFASQLQSHAEHGTPPHEHITASEAVLNCSTCHSNDDRHFALFGQDCAQCHGTEKWTLPEFQHPAAQSTDCAHCHQAPPSHYMNHFQMISRKVAGKSHARVDQCFLCHQTTSWNDILGVGMYKHH